MGADSSKIPENLTDIIKESKYTTGEVKRWYKNFVKLYPDDSLSISAFTNLYCKIYPQGDASALAEQIFRVFDHNQDGHIDFRELVIALGTSCRGGIEEKMKLMFSLYDINDDGFIKIDEMFLIFKSMFQMSTSGVGGKLSSDDTKARQHAEKMFAKIDRNADGRISLDEFISVGGKNIELMNLLTLGKSQ